MEIINKIRRRILYYIRLFKTREHHFSYGKQNPDKTFYVIRIDFPMAGLFAIVKSVLSHILYAVDKGYIPVVDMQNAPNQFQKEINGNPWEFFFKQPLSYKLADIAESRHIVISCNRQIPNERYKITLDLLSPENHSDLNKYASLYKQYIVYSDETIKYLSSCYHSIIGDKKNILGVLCRGTDYLYKKPAGHPIQPDPQLVMDKIEQLGKEYTIDYIYLATEDENILNVFKENFKDRLLYINQKRFGRVEKDYLCDNSFMDKERLMMNLDYLASLYILSKCNYFIGGRTSGSIGACLMSPNYQYTYFWNLGNFPI